MTRLLLFVIVVFIIGCDKDDKELVSRIDPSFQKYVDAFISEASARGKTVSVSNLILERDTELEPDICGVCNSKEMKAIQKIVRIQEKNLCTVHELELETLIFHELGHCLLGREHDTSLLPNGSPKSIMYPSDLSFYAPCRYAIGEEEEKNCNKLNRRQYYLDELFNPATPTPDWGK